MAISKFNTIEPIKNCPNNFNKTGNSLDCETLEGLTDYYSTLLKNIISIFKQVFGNINNLEIPLVTNHYIKFNFHFCGYIFYIEINPLNTEYLLKSEYKKNRDTLVEQQNYFLFLKEIETTLKNLKENL